MLRRIIEGAADPRDFIQEPERHTSVLEHLNNALRFDGFEVQQQGGRMRLVEAGKGVPVLAELAGLSEVIDFGPRDDEAKLYFQVSEFLKRKDTISYGDRTNQLVGL